MTHKTLCGFEKRTTDSNDVWSSVGIIVRLLRIYYTFTNTQNADLAVRASHL